jgi:hypothetical protein
MAAFTMQKFLFLAGADGIAIEPSLIEPLSPYHA